MSLFKEIIAGNRRALAQALTSIENDDSDYRFLADIYPHTGNAHLIGVTGGPGVGKSTLLNGLVKLMRNRDNNVGILAVDPSSQFTKGAILGDRIRMQDLLGDEGVYIRSMATRGALGGLSNAVVGAVDVLDAAGFDRVFVETSGVGQAEIDIAANSYTTVVVLLPGAGDSIQVAKAGILEIADIIVINKSDYPHANLTKSHVIEMLGIGSYNQSIHATIEKNIGLSELAGDSSDKDNNYWNIPIISTVATSGEGIEELMDQVYAHFEYLCSTGELIVRRQNRIKYIYRLLLQKQLYTKLEEMLLEEHCVKQLDLLMKEKTDPYTIAVNFLDLFENH